MTAIILTISHLVAFLLGCRFISPRPVKVRAATSAADYVKRAEWKRLDIQPAIRRKQRIEVIDVG